jgi:hypothetical protein
MSTIAEFEAPTFDEVVAYLQGVADGIRAGRRGTGNLTTCPLPNTRACGHVGVALAEGSHVCDSTQPPPLTRRTIPYLPQGVDTAWPNLVAASLPRARWMDGSERESAAPAGASHRTIPYLSTAVSLDPAAPSVFPVDDRTSGVCLRVTPPSAEWYALTGTDGDGYGSSQDR